MNNTTLVIVDFQYDFCNPNGSLYVKGAEEAKQAIINKLNTDKSINHVIFTLDWHEYCDESFEINGGQWPIHCLQNSIGAGVDTDLIKACQDNGINPEFIYKGDVPNVEEYGAFSSFERSLMGNGINLFNHNKENEVTVLNNIVIVCGIAGDYCVKETFMNLLKTPLSVGLDPTCIASIDGGETIKNLLDKYCTNNG
jgi:nicotinamidase-related amidase